jgi:hypothetical protein
MSGADAWLEPKRWLRFAREDFEAAGLLARQEGVAPREARWLAQQAVERSRHCS